VPPGVRFVATPRPISAAAARNLGARLASGAYLLFLDSDCIAAPDLAERLLERHRSGCRLVGGSVAVEPGPYWVRCDNLLVFAPFLAAGDAGLRGWLPSLNLSVERALFERSGGFDERFPGAAGEDVDLCLRLRCMGAEPFFEPRAVVSHRPARATAGAVWAHLRVFGAGYVGLQRAHAGLLGRSLRFELCRRRPWLAVALSPGMALLDSAQIYMRHPALLRYWYALPGVTFARLAWYVGLTFGPERLAAGALTR
jgi:GT2 family glycosyltransferase